MGKKAIYFFFIIYLFDVSSKMKNCSGFAHPTETDHPQSEKDYRPVSILPALSKVFERLVLKQLISYIDEVSLLAPSISGFRKDHSTVTALLGTVKISEPLHV